MKTRPPLQSRGFTLIELLTVIAIIAILMGLLFPAIASVREAARKTQAKNDVANIVAAVKAYYTEYGKYPDLTGTGGAGGGAEDGKDLWVGYKDSGEAEGKPNSTLFNVLRAIDKAPNDKHRLNPRKIVFFEGKAAANPEAPRAGFADQKSGAGGAADTQGSYYDPWGKQYLVMVDSNYDNILDMEQLYTDFTDDDRPRTGVGAISKGKDEKRGDAKGSEGKYRDKKNVSDDVISWQ
jgi:prepilin-type N-terminal cleavage/methylation domain-containing protein